MNYDVCDCYPDVMPKVSNPEKCRETTKVFNNLTTYTNGKLTLGAH